MMGFAVAVKSRKMASDLELYSTVFKFSHLVNLAMYAVFVDYPPAPTVTVTEQC